MLFIFLNTDSLDINKMRIKKNNQLYLKKILKENPSLSSGRKNYDTQYLRILKNILLTKMFISGQIYNKKKFCKKVDFINNKEFLKIMES